LQTHTHWTTVKQSTRINTACEHGNDQFIHLN